MVFHRIQSLYSVASSQAHDVLLQEANTFFSIYLLNLRA